MRIVVHALIGFVSSSWSARAPIWAVGLLPASSAASSSSASTLSSSPSRTPPKSSSTSLSASPSNASASSRPCALQSAFVTAHGWTHTKLSDVLCAVWSRSNADACVSLSSKQSEFAARCRKWTAVRSGVPASSAFEVHCATCFLAFASTDNEDCNLTESLVMYFTM